MIHPHLILTSHGLKRAKADAKDSAYVVPQAHLYIDARGVPDGMGPDQVHEWLGTSDGLDLRDAMVQMIFHAVDRIPARRSRPDQDPHALIHICCLCAWGSNRSPGVKAALGRMISEIRPDWTVEVR